MAGADGESAEKDYLNSHPKCLIEDARIYFIK